MGNIFSLQCKNKSVSNEKKDDFIIIENKYQQPITLKNYNLIDIDPDTIHIDSNIINKIQTIQLNAYIYDKTGIELFECCICFADNNEMMPIKCTHPICIKCYQTIINMNDKKCPLCREIMEPIEINKLFCVGVPILKKSLSITDDIQTYFIPECDDHFLFYGIAILYLPPIYNKNDGKWIDQDFFFDIMNNHFEQQRFINTFTMINNEKYRWVTSSIIGKSIRKIFPNLQLTFSGFTF